MVPRAGRKLLVVERVIVLIRLCDVMQSSFGTVRHWAFVVLEHLFQPFLITWVISSSASTSNNGLAPDSRHPFPLPHQRSDLVPLVNALHKGNVIGLYLLSESCHCQDDLNVEITAHQQEDGSYILNTPNEEATK